MEPLQSAGKRLACGWSVVHLNWNQEGESWFWELRLVRCALAILMVCEEAELGVVFVEHLVVVHGLRWEEVRGIRVKHATAELWHIM